MAQGWISLHRSILDWEWYGDINVRVLFLHCLIKANHRPKQWRGQSIPRGSFITGRKKLAEETGLTEQQIRTSIAKLTATNEITTKPTNKNTLLTIVKYNDYQNTDNELTSRKTTKPTTQSTNNQPTGNQQLTTTNNENNENNENKKEKARASLSEKLGVEVGLIERIVKHRRDISKPANTDKKITLVVNDLKRCVEQGFFSDVNKAMDKLDSEPWQTLKPDYLSGNKFIVKPQQNSMKERAERFING